MAPSTSNLKQLLKYQSKCEKLEMFDGQGQLVLIVTQFIIKLCSEDDEIIILLKSLEDSAKLCWIYSRRSEEDRKFSTMFWDFISQLKVFFQVPNFKSTADPNEVDAAFVDLLLEILEEILQRRPYFIHRSVEEFILIQKELKFLIIFLGDTPSQLIELETTKNVLKDIEDVANDVGSFLYSFFLSKDRISIAAMNDSLSVLLGNVKLVKESIENHCYKVANIRPSGMTPKTAVVSLSFVDSILDYIDDLLDRDDDRTAVLKDQIDIIYLELTDLKNGIKELEIERHQEREEFCMQLINVAYEVEYIINSFAPVSYITLRLLQVTKKIEPMRMQLQELKKNDAGMLKDAEYPRQHISLPAQRPQTGEDYLYGFKDVEMEIIESLLKGPPRLQVISITGMPGLGKTTLAKRLYNDPRISDHFDKRIWCVVSRTYQSRNFLIDILMSTDINNKEYFLSMEDGELAKLLNHFLKGTKYIIVMDDIRKVNVWDDINKFFPDDGNGSRILFTSRNVDVVMKDSYGGSNYPLRFLVEDESWDLLQWKVFNKEPCPPELVDVGKKIARNCDGLPITIVMIASVLKNLEKKISLWMEVAENITSHISKETNEYMSVLEHSYNDLPMYLKPCFLYFGVFEKGSEIPVQKLIMLWHAEGFVGKVEGKSLEDVAQEYLMDLINRSLLRVAKRKSDGGIKSCTIHGAMHDMCLRLAEKDNFVKVITDRLSVYEQHLRLSIHSRSIPSYSRPFGLHIRSLLGYLHDPSAFIFSSLNHLKVLDLSTTDLSLYNLSGSEVLAFLKFLAVSSIPSSIGIFKNIELLFVDNKEVVEIPDILSKMENLRRVHFSGGAKFSESWSQATHDESSHHESFQSNLQNLSSIFIYDENDEKILRSFPKLRMLKCKYTVFWDSSKNCYRYPALEHFIPIESLNISFRSSYVLDGISPELILPLTLKKLTLRNFDLSRTHMKIIGELPSLEVLKLRDDTIEEKQWDTNKGEFVRLKYLELDAVQIEHWNTDGTHFPSLEILVLRNLKMLPSSFGKISTLQKIEVHGCANSVRHSAVKIKEEQELMSS